jgi:hypothetical protein
MELSRLCGCLHTVLNEIGFTLLGRAKNSAPLAIQGCSLHLTTAS